MSEKKVPGNGCAVLVPAYGQIEPECNAALIELERRGYTVWRTTGIAQVDLARSQMASDALAAGFEETMWIDADVGFNANDVDRLRAHRLPVVAGIYPKKGKRELAVHSVPGTESIVFGKAGGLLEIKYAATGFLLVAADVYHRIQEHCKLPICNKRFGKPMVPYFQPMPVKLGDDDYWYLGEDFSFCERSRQAGFKVMADTSIRLSHFGRYGYSWEDAGEDRPRYATYNYKLS